MSVQLQGVPAAPGIATGAPWIHRPASADATAERPIADAAAEAADELATLADRLREAGRPDEAGILDAQALMAGDPELVDTARAAEAAGVHPVTAITAAGEEAALMLEALDDEVLSARAADVRDVAARIARHLAGAPAPRLERRSIAVAEDLAPSITVELDRAHLAGIALEGGSRTSHAAILARALGIPAVVGVAGLVAGATDAAELAIDGDAGIAILDPDADAHERLERASSEQSAQREADAAFAGRPLATADGHRVMCAANIAEPAEAEAAFAAGAEGIGLFRTEFAFAARVAPPSVAEQTAAYERVLRAAGAAAVVVRLADIGGDKPLPYVAVAPEANPFLGVRAIRLAESHPALFETQIQAILAASRSAGRSVAIMAPMVADVADALLVRDLVEKAREAVPDAPAPRIGIMVEVPSAVLVADQLAGIMDFMSIGTNDLTQYLLAADRGNPKLADRQDPLHPAVLRAVSRVVDAAHGSGRECEVAVCGEMAGDPAGALLLVGLGVDELSMEPRAFNAVKRAVAARTRAELAELAVAAQALTSASDVRASVVAA
jgi:phosphoenolpyruvate-protein phosphotransferase